MKTRQGFVSNSSTSSFVCAISGSVVVSDHGGNMDGDMAECSDCGNEFLLKYMVRPKVKSLSDEDLVKIVLADETFCEDQELPEDEEVQKKPRKELEELFDKFIAHIDDDSRYSTTIYLTKPFCPICNMKEIPKDVLFQYLLKQSGLTKKTMMEKIRAEFDSYEALVKAVGKK